MKTASTPKPSRIAALLAAMTAAAGLLPTPSVHAADINWNPSGGGDTSWSNGSNWNGGSAPVNDLATDVAVFSNTTAYNFQPSLDQFTVRSVKGLKIGGASTVLLTLGANSGTKTTSSSFSNGSGTLTLSDVSGLAVGQAITGTGLGTGTFITGIDIGTNTVTLSRPATGNVAAGATITAISSLRIGSSGITLEAGTPSFGSNINNTIAAPIVLGANQTWNNQAASRTLAVQGSIFLDGYTLTLNGVANSTISFNGTSGTQSIGGSGSIVVDTDGNASFGPGSGGRQLNTFTGGVTLNKGRIILNGGNSGGSGNMGGLGTGVFTINGGSISGAGNIAGRQLTNSSQVWNADWQWAGGKGVHMGTGAITLGTALGTSRTINATDSNTTNTITFGGGISDGTTAKNLIKTGVGHIALAGINTYTGDTTITAGSLTLTETGALTFYIGANGINNSVNGAGTFNANGIFIFDTSGADAVNGSNWSIVDTGSLTESFSATFAVQDFTETAPDSGIWVLGNFSFDEASGILSYSAVPEPSTYALFAGVGMLAFGLRRKFRASRS